MLAKQAVDISFAQGLDTKTDPKRIQMGNFVSLENSVFINGGLLQKRNGYASLASLPDTSYSYLTTLNGNLTAIGSNIAAYNKGISSWISKGDIQPVSLNTLALIRNNYNQTSCDSAIAPNGLVCTVYEENNGTATTNKYVIADSITGQNVVAPTVIPVNTGTVSGGMRVFVLGNNFIIIFTNTISATAHLQYIAVSIVNPTLVGSNTDIAASYVSSTTLSWDAYVSGINLYIAYNTTSGGQSVVVTSLSKQLTPSGSPITFSGYTATMMSVTVDSTVAIPLVYISFYNSGSSTGFTAAVDQNLNKVMNPVEIIASGTYLNMTSAAQNGVCSIFAEVSNHYSYDSSVPSNYINLFQVKPSSLFYKSIFSSGAGTITVSSATGLTNGMYVVDNTTASHISAGTTFTVSGTTLTLSQNTAGNSAGSPGDTLTFASVASAVVSIRSIGLASKAFINNGIIYYLGAYQSSYQPTYFLVNGSTSTAAAPVLVAKLAYQNGGGYLINGLPNISINDGIAFVPYLYKDLIQAANKDTNVSSGTQIAGIYSQTGINLASFELGTQGLDTAEIANDLHLSGGFLWAYDGYVPVEHNFFLWPDNVKATIQADPAPTATTTSSSPTLTSVSSVAGIVVGMSVSGTGIPSDTTVIGIGTTTITMSKNATGSGSGVIVTFTGNQTSQQYYYEVTYEWSDNQGNIYRSAPSIPVTATTTSGSSSVVINIPTLRLTMKTANPVKVVIYRWSVGQQIYYQTTSLTIPLLNSTTTDSVQYIDINTDATILGNNILYTTGGVAEDVNAPASNLLTLFDTRLWLVDAEDKNLLWFSKQVIEGTPVEMSDLFTVYVPPTTSTQGSTGPITSIAPMDDKLIIGKENAFLYINGTGPDNTGANNQYSQPIFITATVGCTNQKSIVLIPNGLMFQSDKGIWLLDRGLNTTYIGAAVEAYTNGALVNSAVNVPETNQVRFTLNTGFTLMYDYYYSQWGVFTGVPAISSCIYEDMHTFIDSYGAAYQESEGQYLDGSNPVLMSFKTGPLRLGNLQNYQRAYFFYLLGTYISPHKLQIKLYYDYETSPTQSVIISPINYSTPYGSGSSQSPYGQGTPYGGPSNLENWRVFLQKQRCMAFAIELQEIFDSTYGTTAGAGLTLSGLNIVMGMKRAFRPQNTQTSIG
jgi:hypothetical protein